MANDIQVLDNGNYFLKARGAEMTLERNEEGWSLYVVNASVKAWRNGFAIPKHFDSLSDLESKYRSWVGIAAIAENINQNNFPS